MESISDNHVVGTGRRRFDIPEYFAIDTIEEMIEKGKAPSEIRGAIEEEMKNTAKYAENLLPLLLMGLAAEKHLHDKPFALKIFDIAWSMAKVSSDMLMVIEFLSRVEFEGSKSILRQKLLIAAERSLIEKDMLGFALVIYMVHGRLVDCELSEFLFSRGKKEILQDGAPHWLFEKDLKYLLEFLKSGERNNAYTKQKEHKDMNDKHGSTEKSEHLKAPLSLLDATEEPSGYDEALMEADRRIIQEYLDHFVAGSKIVGCLPGPSLNVYEIQHPSGMTLRDFRSIKLNLQTALDDRSIRIAPAPTLGNLYIEVPKQSFISFPLRRIMETDAWKKNNMEMPVIIGRDALGEAVVEDLTRAPHMLIAGATGSGKSVLIHSMILSLLYKFGREGLKLLLFDSKLVEFMYYKPLQGINADIVNAEKDMPRMLEQLCEEMERRYKLFYELRIRKLSDFNGRDRSKYPEKDGDGNEIPDSLPYIVVVIDELADLMMREFKYDVEMSIARLAQKARAAGIHMVIATQTPRVNIITGTIKANIPTRISFYVSNQTNSRVIMDEQGAESLSPIGDMLYRESGSEYVRRIQAPMVHDHEIERVVDFIVGKSSPTAT